MIEEKLSRKITILLPRSFDQKLNELCEQTDRTKSNLIRFLLYRSLDQSEKKFDVSL